MFLNKKEYARAVLIDLSKAFAKINHELLLIAKLHAYGFSKNALKQLLSFISDRQHRTKFNDKSVITLIVLHLIFAISLNFALEKVEEQCNIAMTWFEKNYMKMSSDV